ncbi:MAG TPA: VIT and VWA domain-containing protein [Candidatus Hydrogenedentes bacterium]|nr:VIT and VWA domain-containing protein [Candidatus Hydrogenedentota bacterium]
MRKNVCKAIAGVLLALGWASSAFAAPVTEGALQAVDQEGNLLGYCPLKHTDVKVDISGFVARVTLTQKFEALFPNPIEAVYVFPMSERGAVDSMTMTIGDRVIRGDIKKRAEARQIYEEAKRQGKTASLLDQERPNIFTQSVANILPGSAIDITITYVESLEYEAGEYTFAFPMVVGPRYIPGQPLASATSADHRLVPGLKPGPDATDRVPDSGRIMPPVTPEGTRAGHDVSLEVRLDAGVSVQDVISELHKVDIERPSERQAVVRLQHQNEIPNRDFILRYKVAGATLEDAVLTHADKRGGFFTLIMQPPANPARESVAAKELYFVIDCSGSMSGFPIEKAKEVMRRCIEGLGPADTFNLVSFAGGMGFCFDNPVPNSGDHRAKALEYLRNLQGGGGTEMLPAIHAALADQKGADRLRVACFMTDGFIGNDFEILDAIQENAGTARVFAFGIGNSVNRFLIEGMGRLGRGASEIVSLESDADKAVARYIDRVKDPLLTDLSVAFDGVKVSDVLPEPSALPDLFAGRPLVLKGRYNGSGDGAIVVKGKAAGRPFERRIPVSFKTDEPANEALASLWAREKIEQLIAKDYLGAQHGKPDKDVEGAVTDLGLTYRLVTQYTSFVAVEQRVVTKGGKTVTVEVPVEMPDGVSYSGVFGDGGQVMSRGEVKSGGGRLYQTTAGKTMPAAEPRLSVNDAAEIAVALPEKQSGIDVASPASSVTKDDAALAKLDPALAALVKGNAGNANGLKIVDGMVVVKIELTALNDEYLAAIKALGIDIIAQTYASNTVLAKAPTTLLKAIAERPYVVRITSATSSRS